MKKETAELLQKYTQSGKITLEQVPEGLKIESDLTDDQVAEIVKLEYGNSEQDVNALFDVILRKIGKMAIEYAKSQV